MLSANGFSIEAKQNNYQVCGEKQLKKEASDDVLHCESVTVK